MNNTPRTSPIIVSFEALWQWLMAKPGQPSPAPARNLARTQQIGSPARTEPLTGPVNKKMHTPALMGQTPALRRSVRVLQVMDAGQSPAQSGRLRISGRMADVCAELDRLAACEALQH